MENGVEQGSAALRRSRLSAALSLMVVVAAAAVLLVSGTAADAHHGTWQYGHDANFASAEGRSGATSGSDNLWSLVAAYASNGDLKIWDQNGCQSDFGWCSRTTAEIQWPPSADVAKVQTQHCGNTVDRFGDPEHRYPRMTSLGACPWYVSPEGVWWTETNY